MRRRRGQRILVVGSSRAAYKEKTSLQLPIPSGWYVISIVDGPPPYQGGDGGGCRGLRQPPSIPPCQRGTPRDAKHVLGMVRAYLDGIGAVPGIGVRPVGRPGMDASPRRDDWGSRAAGAAEGLRPVPP